ncbi:hypothetical protein [Nocardia lasii]|uniref:Uncharacterized protein n=1 Tax=Nocardia lasii TaxID=1616107 RepID=A0ABW1JQ50_9NOCA
MNQPWSILARGRAGGHHDPRAAATRFVIERVESTGAATQDDFDIDMIVETARQQIDDWNIQAMPSADFWRIAAICIKG